MHIPKINYHISAYINKILLIKLWLVKSQKIVYDVWFITQYIMKFLRWLFIGLLAWQIIALLKDRQFRVIATTWSLKDRFQWISQHLINLNTQAYDHVKNVDRKNQLEDLSTQIVSAVEEFSTKTQDVSREQYHNFIDQASQTINTIKSKLSQTVDTLDTKYDVSSKLDSMSHYLDNAKQKLDTTKAQLDEKAKNLWDHKTDHSHTNLHNDRK